QVILTLTQRRRIELPNNRGTYYFRGGGTHIIDLDGMEIRHCIRRPITDEARRMATEAYITEGLPPALSRRFFKRGDTSAVFEPFAFLHSMLLGANRHAE